MYKDHSSLKTPQDHISIWRYMGLDKFLYLLTEKKLYFCRSDKFRDPWEGIWPKNIVQWLKSEEFKNSVGGNDADGLLSFSSELKKVNFINCWHNNSHQSAAMWDLYAGDGSSIAIKSSIDRIKRGIICEEDFYIGEVQYLDYEQDSIWDFNMLLPFFMKRNSFKHEEEVRILIQKIPTQDGQANFEDALDFLFVEVDLAILINEIYISPTAPKWMRQILEKIIKKFDLEPKALQQSDLYESSLY